MQTLYFAAVVTIFFFVCFFFSSPTQWLRIGCLPYFHTWCGLSANLECRSEMCFMQLTENTRTQKLCKKNYHLHTIAQRCRAASSQLRHYQQSEKNLLNSNISSTCAENMLTTEIMVGDFGTPSKFQQVLRLGFVTAPTSLSRGNQTLQCLSVSWAGTLYIHFWGLLPSNAFLPGLKFTLHPSLAFSYIGSVTARHSSSRR